MLIQMLLVVTVMMAVSLVFVLLVKKTPESSEPYYYMQPEDMSQALRTPGLTDAEEEEIYLSI